MSHTPNTPGIKDSEQNILNWSFDKDYGALAVELLGYNADASTLNRISVNSGGELITNSQSNFCTNDIDEASSTVTYIGKENKDGVWFLLKIDTSSGTSFSYATEINNPTLTNYSTAWAARLTATYGDYSLAF